MVKKIHSSEWIKIMYLNNVSKNGDDISISNSAFNRCENPVNKYYF